MILSPFENSFSDANKRLAVVAAWLSLITVMTAIWLLDVGQHGSLTEIACLAVQGVCVAAAIISKRYLAMAITVALTFFTWFRP